MILPSSLVFLHRVAWLILECARRMSTFISCAFREQEDDQATHPILPRLLVISSGMGAGLSGLSCLSRLSGWSGLSGFSGFPISQPNERDKPNNPDKRDRPVSALPTAAACELKDADPNAEPFHMSSWMFDTSVLHRNSQIKRKWDILRCHQLLRSFDRSKARMVSQGACPTLTVLLRRMIRNHLRRSRPAHKNRET